jgi:hypothetical protein
MIEITLAYRDELRFAIVGYIDGVVSVTEDNGDVHNLVYDSELATLTGPGELSESDRSAIAQLLSTAIAQAESSIAWTPKVIA